MRFPQIEIPFFLINSCVSSAFSLAVAASHTCKNSGIDSRLARAANGLMPRIPHRDFKTLISAEGQPVDLLASAQRILGCHLSLMFFQLVRVQAILKGALLALRSCTASFSASVL